MSRPVQVDDILQFAHYGDRPSETIKSRRMHFATRFNCSCTYSAHLHPSSHPVVVFAAGYVMNIWLKPVTFHVPVRVFCVKFVGTVLPRCSAPLSTRPLATFLCKWFSPAFTVKLARLISKGLRVATDGEPSTSQHGTYKLGTSCNLP
jgi:hypothetical protein